MFELRSWSAKAYGWAVQPRAPLAAACGPATSPQSKPEHRHPRVSVLAAALQVDVLSHNRRQLVIEYTANPRNGLKTNGLKNSAASYLFRRRC